MVLHSRFLERVLEQAVREKASQEVGGGGWWWVARVAWVVGGAGVGDGGAGGGGWWGGGWNERGFLLHLGGAKTKGLFSVLARGCRPLADTSPAWVGITAPASQNRLLIFAWQPRPNGKEILYSTSCGRRARYGYIFTGPCWQTRRGLYGRWGHKNKLLHGRWGRAALIDAGDVRREAFDPGRCRSIKVGECRWGRPRGK